MSSGVEQEISPLETASETSSILNRLFKPSPLAQAVTESVEKIASIIRGLEDAQNGDSDGKPLVDFINSLRGTKSQTLMRYPEIIIWQAPLIITTPSPSEQVPVETAPPASVIKPTALPSNVVVEEAAPASVIADGGENIEAVRLDGSLGEVVVFSGPPAKITEELPVGKSLKRQRKSPVVAQAPDGYILRSEFLKKLDISGSSFDRHRLRGEINLKMVIVGSRSYYRPEDAETVKRQLEAIISTRSRPERNTTRAKERPPQIIDGEHPDGDGEEFDETELTLDRNEESDSVRQYLHEIGEIDLLDRRQEEQLGARIFLGQIALKAVDDLTQNGLLTPDDPDSIKLIMSDKTAKRLLKSVSRLKESTEEEPEIWTDERKPLADIAGDYSRWLREQLQGSSRQSVLERQAVMIQQAINASKTFNNSNLRLVVSVAKKYIGRGLALLDLIQEGNVGLISAVDRYDFRRGYKFSTYATWWIKQGITRAIADLGSPIRLPVHVHGQMAKLHQRREVLIQESGREVTLEETAEGLDLHVGKKLLADAIRAQHTVSLDETLGFDKYDGRKEDARRLGDFLEDPRSEDEIEEGAEGVNLKEQIDEVLDTLTPRERQVLELRFGLKDGRSLTLEEVGKEFAVTRERIRQIEAKALRKLRHPSRSKKLKDWVGSVGVGSQITELDRPANPGGLNLTEIERDVLQLAVNEVAPEQIANRLFIPLKAVGVNLLKIFEKVNELNGTSETTLDHVAALAEKAGFIRTSRTGDLKGKGRMRNNIEGYRQRYEQESADGQLSLTDRQVEVLRLAVDGLGNKEIGEELGIAIATVKVNMVEIFKAAAKADSTDHSNFWRVVKLAIQSGLIESPKADALVSRSKSDQRE